MKLKAMETTGVAVGLFLAVACGGKSADVEVDADYCHGELLPVDAGPPVESLKVRAPFYDAIDEAHPKIEGATVDIVRDPDLNTAVAEAWVVKGLTPGHVVTVWWATFTNTDDCSNGIEDIEPDAFLPINVLCGPGDLSGDSVDSIIPQFGYAGPAPMGGAVVDANGDAVFPTLETAVVDESAVNADFLIGNGLRDLWQSEIHLVLRSHGPEIVDNTELRDAQLGTFDGGCLEGEPNAGQCQNVQFAFVTPYYTSADLGGEAPPSCKVDAAP